MRTKILLFIIFMTSYSAKSQSDTLCSYGWYEYYIASTPGIHFRSEPTQTSESLAFLKFGTKVLVCNDCDKSDNTVDNKDWTNYDRSACWKKAKINDNIGYVFSGYLIESPIYTDKDLCFLIEGALCPTDINYNPNLFWYGVYHMKKSESFNGYIDPHINKLRLVKVKFSTINGLCEGPGASICISTDQDEESLFLVGIDHKLKDSIIRQNNISNQHFGNFIFPGEKVYTTGGYSLQGRGVVTGHNDKDSSPFNFYEIALLNEDNPSIFQIISADFFQKYKPSLVWDGDLNGDNLPDLLFNDYGNYFFLLSNKPERNNIIQRYATLQLWNCN